MLTISTHIKTNFYAANLDTLYQNNHITPQGKHTIMAINSCLQHTHLKTYFIYTGKHNPIYYWLKSKNIHTINRNTSHLTQTINKTYTDQEHQKIALGAWQRIDIPIILKQLQITEKHTLYTDLDTLFTPNWTPHIPIEIPKIACTEERSPNHYNTGVMITNTAYMQETYKEFTQHIYQQKLNKYLTWDQDALNEYYPTETITILPRKTWNWTPYINNGKTKQNQAKIIHFHGPKITNIEHLSGMEETPYVLDTWPLTDPQKHNIPKDCQILYNQNPEGYQQLYKYAQKYLNNQINTRTYN